jgi:hypothetical protein
LARWQARIKAREIGSSVIPRPIHQGAGGFPKGSEAPQRKEERSAFVFSDPPSPRSSRQSPHVAWPSPGQSGRYARDAETPYWQGSFPALPKPDSDPFQAKFRLSDLGDRIDKPRHSPFLDGNREEMRNDPQFPVDGCGFDGKKPLFPPSRQILPLDLNEGPSGKPRFLPVPDIDPVLVAGPFFRRDLPFVPIERLSQSGIFGFLPGDGRGPGPSPLLPAGPRHRPRNGHRRSGSGADGPSSGSALSTGKDRVSGPSQLFLQKNPGIIPKTFWNGACQVYTKISNFGD